MANPTHIVRVDANDPLVRSGLRTLWQYRDLLTVMALRDYRVRFVQTRLGYIWAVIQPLAIVAILTLVFNNIIKVDTGDIPYPLFALSGQILWAYFSFSVVMGGQSLIQSQHIVSKIWFPRAVLPLSKTLVGSIDLAIGLVLVIGTLFLFGLPRNGAAMMLLIPVAVITTLIASFGLSFWASALSVRYRDAQHSLPYIIQFLFFLTPVAFPTSALTRVLGESWSWLAYLNPIAGPIDLMRYALFEGTTLNNLSLISFGMGLLLLWSGWRYFQSVQRNLVDTL